ncbi:MAG: hypothetical protein AAGG46_06290, partial [Planctomycetota bacterium]
MRADSATAESRHEKARQDNAIDRCSTASKPVSGSDAALVPAVKPAVVPAVAIRTGSMNLQDLLRHTRPLPASTIHRATEASVADGSIGQTVRPKWRSASGSDEANKPISEQLAPSREREAGAPAPLPFADSAPLPMTPPHADEPDPILSRLRPAAPVLAEVVTANDAHAGKTAGSTAPKYRVSNR